MRSLTISIIKGGSGKTTTAAALIHCAVREGLKVLAIDLDSQADLTATLGADPSKKGSKELIEGAQLEEVIQQTDQGISLISANIDLQTISTSKGSANRLRESLKGLTGYDLVVIDTPPRIDEATLNALNYTDQVLIPVEAEANNLEGLNRTLELIEELKKSNEKLTIKGVIVTKYNKSRTAKQYRQLIADRCKELGIAYLGEIRQGKAVAEARAEGRSLFEKRSKEAKDYKQLFDLLRA